MKKITIFICVASMLWACKKEKQSKGPIPPAPAFTAPTEGRAINEKVRAFAAKYSEFKNGARSAGESMSTEELEWTFEAVANYLNTDSLVQIDSLQHRSWEIEIPANCVGGSMVISYENAMQKFDELNTTIQDLTNHSPADFYFQFVDAMVTSVSGTSITLHVEESRAFPATGSRIGSNFHAGANYPLFSTDQLNVAKQVQYKLNPYFYNKVSNIYDHYLTNIQWKPYWPGISMSYHTIRSYPYCNNTCTPGTFYYYGSPSHKLLENDDINSVLYGPALNAYKDRLGNYLEFYQTTCQTTYKIIELTLESRDEGYVYSTAIQRAAYPCYPDDYRYRHDLRWKEGILTYVGPGS